MITVLYVDDEAVLLDIGKQFLERTGTITVETATSGKQALMQIAEKSYDAIVSDYQMPGMDGIQFLKALREAGNQIPFIIFTGKGREEVVIQAFENGADFYIQKGGDPKAQFAELAHKVKQAVELRKADTARRESERKLKDIIDFLPDATFAIDMSGNVIAWNRAIEEMTGVRAVDIVGNGDYAYALPFYGERRPILIDLALEEREEVRKRYTYVREEEGRLVAETSGARLQGRDVVLWGTASSLYDGNGRLAGAIESIRDITAIRRADEALRVAQEKYQKAFEAAPDAITISELVSGKFIEVNDAATSIFGYTREEMIGRSALELGIWKNSDDRQALVNKLADIGHVSRFEVIENRKSGEPFIASINADTMTMNGVAYLIAIVRDVSEQKQVEQSLRMSEARFRAIVENASDMIRVLDKNGRIVFETDASVHTLDYPRGSTIGKDPFDYIHPDDRDRVRADLQQVYDGNNPGTPTEFRIRKADGSYAWVESVGRNLTGVPGLDGVVTTTRFIDDRKKADATIRESEERFRAIAEQSQDIIFITDAEGTVTYVSPIVEEVFGYPQQQIIGKQFIAFLLPEERERVLQIFGNIIGNGKPVRNYEFRAQRKDGSVFYGEVNCSAFSSGLFSGTAGILRDITFRKQAEDALRQSYSVLHGVMESPRDVVIFALDRQYRYIAFNENHRRTMQQIWGASIAIGVSMLGCIGDTSDRERARQHFDRALSGEAFTIEEEYGDEAHERRWYEDSYNPVRDENGTIIGVAVFLTDVTDRKRTGLALKESEARFRLIAENTSDTVWMMTLGGTFTYHSPSVEQLRGYTPQEADNLTPEETFTPASLQYIREMLREEMVKPAAAQWADRTIELEMYCKSGDTLWTEVTVRAIRDADGNVTHLQGSTRDITGRKQTEQAIRESEEKFRTLLENMPDLVLVHRNGIALYVNPAMIDTMGYNPEDVIHTPILDYIAPEYREQVVSAIQNRADQVSPAPYEIEILSKNGERRAVIVRGALIEFGGQPAVLNVLTDITERKRADQKLQESEARYSALFDHNYSVSLLIDPDTGQIVDANEAACRYYGYSRDELLGRGIYDLNRLPREKVIADLVRAKGEHEKHFFSTHYLTGGEKRYVEIYSGPITVQGRSLFYSIIHDITDRKRTELALKESEARLQAIIQGSPIPKFVIDREHHVISWNRAMEEMTAIPADDIIGTNLHWTVFYNQPRPCMADLVMDGRTSEVPQYYPGRYWKTDLAGGVYGATDFFPHLGSSGKWLRFVAAPVLDAVGTVIGAVETIEDITELKEKERSLQESEQRYHNIIEDQTEFICRFTPDGTHVFVNEAYARYFGMKREELIGKVFNPNIHPDDREKVRHFFASLTPEHPVDFIQHRIIMPDGKVRWQRWSDRAIFAPDGTLTEYQSVGRDVTVQKQVEEALRVANTRLNLLSSITRHDILNQLLVLDGYLDLLHEEVPDPRLESHFSRISNASTGIASIIRFTKEYEQIGAKEPVWQDIRVLVDRAGRLIDRGRVRLSVFLQDGLEVHADPMFEKVFINLLDNSIRHGKTVTEVRVSTADAGKDLIFLWEDDGVGIPADEKIQIFSAGYGKNTGLGLFLVQEILSINGISIRETGKPGEGARFEITVPEGGFRITSRTD